jgi:hypothetical protein
LERQEKFEERENATHDIAVICIQQTANGQSMKVQQLNTIGREQKRYTTQEHTLDASAC